MDLFKVLKTGYQYTADGELVQIPPNKYMLQAARELERFSVAHQTVSKELEYLRSYTKQLLAEAEAYRLTIKRLEAKIAETKIQPTEPVADSGQGDPQDSKPSD